MYVFNFKIEIIARHTGQAMLHAIARMMKRVAEQQQLAVIATNHTMSASLKWKLAERPALGASWAIHAHVRIMLSKPVGRETHCTERNATIVSSTRHARGLEAVFHLSEAGAVGGVPSSHQLFAPNPQVR